jgi:DNA-binding transcriptional ArsR family regulator/GNAT superfamily N-acetyltransferase
MPARPKPPTSPARREATPAEVRALAHPLRLRIIRLLFDRSLTNRELAQALGEHPATVLHHVRTLLRTGFIEAEAERRGRRGNVEKPYRSTGRSWLVSIDDERAGANVSRAALDSFLAEVRDAHVDAELDTSRLAVNLTAERRHELDERVRVLLEEYATEPPAADGEPYAIFVAIHRRAVPALGEPVAPTTTSGAGVNVDAVITECASDDPIAVLLVRAQWAELSARYGEAEPAPVSIRDPSAFAAPTGTFVVLQVDGETVGCGGICRYDDATAELRAIYVAPTNRGRGYSHLIVEELETRAVALGYSAARLETGDAQPEAIALYISRGYERIENYGAYRDLPRSVCFERRFDSAALSTAV